MSYTCLIVDDEPLARKVIREYLDKVGRANRIIEASDALEAQSLLRSNDIDLLYLDINMPMMTGLELLESEEDKVLTIFTTAYAEHAVKAFELAAFDYLVKPISFSRFQKSYQRAVQNMGAHRVDQAAWMMVKEGKRMYKVPYDEILYLQAYGDYVKIHTLQKVYLMKTRLSALDQQLPKEFVRSHRSYIVGLEKITYLEGNHVVINNEQIPISDGYKEGLLQRL